MNPFFFAAQPRLGEIVHELGKTNQRLNDINQMEIGPTQSKLIKQVEHLGDQP